MIDLVLIAVCVFLAVFAGIQFWQSQKASDSGPVVLEEDAPKAYKVSSVRQSLQTLNIAIEPLVLMVLVLLFSVCVFLVFLEFFPDAWTMAAAAGCAATIMAYFLLSDLSRWARSRFEQKLIEALDLVQAAVQGGVSPQKALRVAADATKGAVGKELREVADRLGYGLPIDKAMERMQYRYNSESVRLFKQAMIAKWESGGDFAPLLRSISELMREQLKIRIQIAAQLSGAKYAAIFTGALPYLLVPLFLWKQPDWFDPLRNSEYGSTYLLVAVLCQVFGYLWLRRLLRVEL